MNIIPEVSVLKKCEGQILLPEIIYVYDCNCRAVNALVERLNACGIKTKLCGCEQAFISLIKTNEKLPTGGYKAEINENGVSVFYTKEEGAHNACATVFMLLFFANLTDKALQYVIIEDFPKYKHRGVHLDTARHYFSPSEIMKLIEGFSIFKINILHWHFADDQAWRLQSKAYPALTENCGQSFYKREDVEKIISFAQSRGISIIPEIEIPGHSCAAISAYPILSCREVKIKTPETGGVFKSILCAGKPETYSFIESILNEVCELFPYNIVHLGGDEAPKDEWQNCPHCKNKLAELGLQSFEQLQAHMLNFAVQILKRHGKIAVCWNECLKADNLDKSIKVHYWFENGLKSYCKRHLSREFVFSNVVPLYLDYPPCINGLKSIYKSAPKMNGKKTAELNISGMECAIWTERINSNEKLEQMLFPRVLAFSEAAWCGVHNYENFLKRTTQAYTILESFNINAMPLKQASVKGLRRLAEIAGFAALMLKEKTKNTFEAKNITVK